MRPDKARETTEQREQVQERPPVQETQVEWETTEPLSKTEARDLVSIMEQQAEPMPVLELTPENWYAEFGEAGEVETPIGQVIMGENQYLKMQAKGRTDQLGMAKPTLTNPDVILEEYDPIDNAERDTKLLFVKTFTDGVGKKHIHFESVTVSKGSKEVVVSNHIINKNALQNKLQNAAIVYNKFTSSGSEMRLAGNRESGLPNLVSTQEVNLQDKGTNISENNNIGQKNTRSKRKGWPMSKADQERLIKEPQSFEEAVLQFFLGGGRMSMDDYYTHFGKSREEMRKNIWMYSKKGQRLDALNEN
ncbi:MAG TPA: hypothetical protein GXZ49_05580, partial [Bacteroidetes bacterium]|nr:hypothetical protein [Bacteroidota bacterium]